MSYEDLGKQVGALVDEKQKGYGDSFNKSAKLLKVLFPDGVPVDRYTDLLCIVRMLDKLFRLATDPSFGDESPYRDMAGYSLLGLMKSNGIETKKTEQIDLESGYR